MDKGRKIMSERLYYGDVRMAEFDAVVTGCVKNGDIYEITLDREKSRCREASGFFCCHCAFILKKGRCLGEKFCRKIFGYNLFDIVVIKIGIICPHTVGKSLICGIIL